MYLHVHRHKVMCLHTQHTKRTWYSTNRSSKMLGDGNSVWHYMVLSLHRWKEMSFRGRSRDEAAAKSPWRAMRWYSRNYKGALFVKILQRSHCLVRDVEDAVFRRVARWREAWGWWESNGHPFEIKVLMSAIVHCELVRLVFARTEMMRAYMSTKAPPPLVLSANMKMNVYNESIDNILWSRLWVSCHWVYRALLTVQAWPKRGGITRESSLGKK